MNESRKEHLQYCKDQAYREYDFHMSGKEFSEPEKAIQHACTSMIADLAKHPETKELPKAFIWLSLTVDSVASMRRFIDGFN